MIDETLIKKYQAGNGQNESKNANSTWKHVTLGGVSGILMGAGLMVAEQAYANAGPDTTSPEGQASNDESSIPVAHVSEDLSFADAFTAARAAVGPGGVFEWHGGLYNTYSAAEWDAMTDEQKLDFAQQVHPITPVEHLQVPTDNHTHVVVVHDVNPIPDNHEGAVNETAVPQDDVHMVEQQIARNFDMGDDVHIVGYANIEGHLAVGYDATGDGDVDVAIIDMDDDFKPSDPDIIVNNQGHMAQLGDLANALEPDTNPMTTVDDTEGMPDVSDVMDDSLLVEV